MRVPRAQSTITIAQPQQHTHTHTNQASLQNLLDLALSSLRAIPEYGHREVVLLYGALTTCDPADVFETIKKLVRHRVRVRFWVVRGVLGSGGSDE